MQSLKEIQTRIESVKSTRKITSAMKMIASAKLHKSEKNISNLSPYKNCINKIITNLIPKLDEEYSSIYTQRRKYLKSIYVLFTSNSSLCGGYNSNIIKAYEELNKKDTLNGVSIVNTFSFGKKGYNYLKKMQVPVVDYSTLNNNSSFYDIKKIADVLIKKYIREEVDIIKIIYHKFKSIGKQEITIDQFLPIPSNQLQSSNFKNDYIIEPDKEQLFNELIPEVLRTKLYSALLHSMASEHASRLMAMQTATENADQLLEQLTLQFNKGRQQTITNELLDIVGTSFSKE